MKKLMTILMCAVLSFGVITACATNDGGDLTGDPTKKTTINFWGWGDQDEVEVFKSLVDKFNAENTYGIEVKYTQKPSDGYSGMMEQTLSGSKAPDVFYVADGDVKKWAKLELIAPIDQYVKESKDIDLTEFWPSSVQRYRYNVASNTSGAGDPLYGLPKDISPTVLFYNADALKSVGVTVISKDIKDPTIQESEKRGYNSAAKVFNNQIAMTWDEVEDLSKLLTKSYNASSPTDYGYFTEWWFNYAWSIGGDCIDYNQTTGKYTFSLGSEEVRKNAEGEDMPSTREAFTRFVNLSQPISNGGLAITPSPNTLSTSGKSNYFTSGKVAMMVDGRFVVTNYRKNAKFDWDCAPLPVAENGIEAGHSGSMAMGMWKYTKKPLAAYKFIEFIAGEDGQSAQAEKGFNIPNQRDLANSEVFLQSDQKPKNAMAFVRAAEYQRAGDWTYMPSNAWIAEWAPTLNDAVRNGSMSLSEFFSKVTANTNKVLATY